MEMACLDMAPPCMRGTLEEHALYLTDLACMLTRDRSVLLGHNGAGKTTTMSMLVGYFPGTRGSIRLNGVDVFGDVKEGESMDAGAMCERMGPGVGGRG
jgi:ABC-type branched-subunit amino acid transport system ATPase component